MKDYFFFFGGGGFNLELFVKSETFVYFHGLIVVL
jgi:hypothetical protein